MRSRIFPGKNCPKTFSRQPMQDLVKPSGQLTEIMILNDKIEVLIPDTDNLRSEILYSDHSLYDEEEFLDENSILNALQDRVNNPKVVTGYRSWIKRSWRCSPEPADPSRAALVCQQRKYDTNRLGFVVSSRKLSKTGAWQPNTLQLSSSKRKVR